MVRTSPARARGLSALSRNVALGAAIAIAVIVVVFLVRGPAAESPPPNPVPPPVPTDSEAEQTGAFRFPADLIDTNEWYLTLPTGSEGKPDTVAGERLKTLDNEWFTLNESRDGVVFTANAGGVTTEGSNYPRSELREMKGSEKAAWDGRSGTHVMELDQAITQVPSTKPDVIAGQIHGGDDDVMQIHLSGSQLTVKYDDGDKEVVLDGSYRIGERFTVKIVSSDGHVRVWHNGELKADLPIFGAESYFKAGAYVNSNTDKGANSSDIGQVVIYKLDISHSS